MWSQIYRKIRTSRGYILAITEFFLTQFTPVSRHSRQSYLTVSTGVCPPSSSSTTAGVWGLLRALETGETKIKCRD